MADDPTTEQLRAIQTDRARRQADEAQTADEEPARRAAARRADKAAYLADKLAEQEESERE